MTRGELEVQGVVDLHSHLVPGVDDGSRSLAEALDGVRRMVDSGVARIVTTPHLDASLTRAGMDFDRRLERVDAAWARLSEAVAEAHPELELGRGFEVRIDVPDPDLSDPRTRLDGTDHVLIEWPGMTIPPGTEQIVEKLRRDGLRPVVAHPERYSGLRDRPGWARRWREAGAILQVNHGSLVGRYGSRVRANALLLLREGWVDLLASDFHGRPDAEVEIEAVAARFADAGAREQFELLAVINPGRLLRGEEPLEVGPLPGGGEGLLGRLKGLLHGGLQG